MKVLKFGGTSVGTAQSLANVKKIVENLDDRAVVVVSALGGLTDRLIAAAEMARKGSNRYSADIQTLLKRHHEIIDELVPVSRRQHISGYIDSLAAELARIYDGVAMLRDLTDHTLAQVVSYGERMSSVLVAEIIDGAKHFHSPDFIKTEKWFNRNIADSGLTEKLIRQTLGGNDYKVAVVGGFISTDRDSGEITNLGRGGSDYTAALIAAALDADVLQIWTDVDGFMTADPKIIDDAFVIDHLSFIESMELCTMGAKVIYPPTIYPVFHKNIPIRILNTFRPEMPGTWITDDTHPSDMPIKGVTALYETTMISMRLTGGYDEEIISRAYNAMTKNGVNVFLLSGRNLDSGFSFAVSASADRTAINLLEDEFSSEISHGYIKNIKVAYNLSTVAIVGEKLRGRTDLLPTVMPLLDKEGIKLHATSDGNSDNTLALLVGRNNVFNAIKVIHDHFLGKPRRSNKPC